MRHFQSFFSTCFILGGLLGGAAFAQSDPITWPEPQRAFFQDGPALLLTPEQRLELRSINTDARERFIREFLDKDPVPDTPANELQAGIDRRLRLATSQLASPTDVRAQLLFLNGPPAARKELDCGFVFEPLEIWTYHEGKGTNGKPLQKQLVVFRPSASEPWRLWLPSDSKRALYTDMMEYWMEQWEELRGRVYIKRIDLQNCEEVKEVDEATGVQGLTGALGGKKDPAWIKPKDASTFMDPPKDLAAWARAAAATDLPEAPPALEVSSFDFRFPTFSEQRMVVRTYLGVEPEGLQPAAPATPPVDQAAAAQQATRPEAQLAVDGVLESEGKPFESFRLRYRLPLPDSGGPLPLVLERRLRPRTSFLMRLHIRDETSGREARIARAFAVPASPTGDDLEAKASNIGQLVPPELGQGRDSLLLLPPPADVVLGLWRADVLITGERIKKVVYLVDGAQQLAKTTPPFSAEVRLSRFPTEQMVRAEGYDAAGKLVAADEVILNQPRGALGVWITEPAKGTRVQPGKLLAKAEISIPDGRRVEKVEFLVNDKSASSLTQPPWQAELPIPAEEVVYMTVVATLDDGGRTEACASSGRRSISRRWRSTSSSSTRPLPTAPAISCPASRFRTSRFWRRASHRRSPGSSWWTTCLSRSESCSTPRVPCAPPWSRRRTRRPVFSRV